MKHILLLIILFTPSILQSHSGQHRNTIKCGTFMPHGEQKKLIQICDFDFTMRHIMDKKYQSPGGKFLIHYDTEGVHAVDMVDQNSNGIPDYVDSVAYYADFAYSNEVDEMGYYSPVPEPGGTSDLYDIYLYELGKGANLYGLTKSDQSIGVPPNDKGYKKFHSFIVIDNNYSPADSTEQDGNMIKTYKTDGIDALKITLVHEFHHAIQYVYGNMPNGALFAEMTSTSMEYRFFPEIKDYYQYVDYLFESLYKYPFGVDDYRAGYSYSIFAQYLYKLFGDDLLRRSWEIVDETNDKRISYVTAIDLALKENGSDFETIWKEFQPYIYFTGSRAQGTTYLDDAAELPEIKFYQTQETLNGTVYSSGQLKPLEQRCIRFTLRYENSSSDTLDILLTNLDLDDYGYNPPSYWNYNLRCSAEHFDGATNEQNKDVFWQSEDPNDICYFLPYLYKGNKAVFLDFAFPNPYIPRQHTNMFLPVPKVNNLYTDINVVVFASNMHEVFSGTYPFDIMEDGKVVVNISDKARDLQSGVYLYKISTEENDYFGKFVVKDTK